MLPLSSSNKCLTSSNKKLVETSASLVVTSASLVVTSALLLVTSAFLESMKISGTNADLPNVPRWALGRLLWGRGHGTQRSEEYFAGFQARHM